MVCILVFYSLSNAKTQCSRVVVGLLVAINPEIQTLIGKDATLTHAAPKTVSGSI